MIPIRKIEYELKAQPNEVFSRLSWVVERVNNLWSQLIIYTVSTERRWVGTLDESKLSFELIRPSSMWNRPLFQIIVKGTIHSENGNTIVKISMKLGLITSLVFISIYGFGIFILANIFNDIYTDSLMAAAIWLAVFPLGGTALVTYKLKLIERDLDRLFDK